MIHDGQSILVPNNHSSKLGKIRFYKQPLFKFKVKNIICKISRDSRLPHLHGNILKTFHSQYHILVFPNCLVLRFLRSRLIVV
jgi:hypothetical protein